MGLAEHGGEPLAVEADGRRGEGAGGRAEPRRADALGDVVREVAARDPGARLNLLLSDGSRLLATTWGDTLSVLTTSEGTALASEPWDDDPAWSDLPDHHLIEVTSEGVHLTPLEDA